MSAFAAATLVGLAPAVGCADGSVSTSASDNMATIPAEWRVRYESAASIFVPTLLFRSQPLHRNVQQSSSQPYA